MAKSRFKTILSLLLVIAFLLISVPGARAQVGMNGYFSKDFATGFPISDHGYGPIGLAFDSSGNLLVMDYANGYMYKFGPSGGVASTATQVNLSAISGSPFGLAFTKDWRLYLARAIIGDVVELDPATGKILRTIANISGAIGIATDPLSGDLFVSNDRTTISRISNFGSGPGTVTLYVSPIWVDGLTFVPDGTLYVAIWPRAVAKISGTNSAKPGVVTPILDVPFADGIALATDSSFLLVNRNDGNISKLSITADPAKLTDIVTGGSRGDFTAVGPDGCLYATQSSSVIKVTNADGSCSLIPTGPLSVPKPAATGNDFLSVYGWILALCCLAGGVGVLGVIAIVIFMRRNKKI